MNKEQHSKSLNNIEENSDEEQISKLNIIVDQQKIENEHHPDHKQDHFKPLKRSSSLYGSLNKSKEIIVNIHNKFKVCEDIISQIIYKISASKFGFELGSLVLLENCMIRIKEKFELSSISTIIVDEVLNKAYLCKLRNK